MCSVARRLTHFSYLRRGSVVVDTHTHTQAGVMASTNREETSAFTLEADF